jgi:hypothetical protein
MKKEEVFYRWKKIFDGDWGNRTVKISDWISGDLTSDGWVRINIRKTFEEIGYNK